MGTLQPTCSLIYRSVFRYIYIYYMKTGREELGERGEWRGGGGRENCQI